MSGLKEHWEGIYGSNEETSLGWYEKVPEKSLELIDKCEINEDDSIINIGSGVSTLIDILIEKGFKNIVAIDISEKALNKTKERLERKKKASFVKFAIDDISNPKKLGNLKNIKLWHDRAVLHFLTKKEERKNYLSVLKQSVNVGGYVIIAVFSLEGVEKCSGLELRRYDSKMLQEFLGDDFELIEDFNYEYTMPSRDKRLYVYTLFKRLKGGRENE